jgi:hypothetical protein
VANEYAPLSALKRARKIPLSDTADDGALRDAIEQASRAVDDRCGRRFYLDGASSTRIIRARGRVVPDDGSGDGETLLIPDAGSEPTLVESSDDRSAWATVGGWFSDPDVTDGYAITGLVRDRSGWSGRWFRVTAQWGWPSIPAPIANATLLLANRRFVRLDSPEGVAGWAQEGQIRISRFDPDIEDLVAPYVLPGFA